MSLKVPTPSNISIQANINTTAVNSVTLGTETFNLPIPLANVQNLQILSGSYTPNNDVFNIPLAMTACPNFIMFVCDGLCNVGEESNKYFVNIPVTKFFMSTLASTLTSAHPLDVITINGQTSAYVPMIQGVLVNWTILVGFATVS